MRGKLLDAFRSIVTIFAMRNDIFIVTVQRQIPALLLRRQHTRRASLIDTPNDCLRARNECIKAFANSTGKLSKIVISVPVTTDAPALK